VPSVGANLACHYKPGEDDSVAVVLSHGLTNSRQDAPLFGELDRALAQAGLGVVGFDYFGSGESDGGFSDKTLSIMLRNLEDVLASLQRRLGPAGRVGLFGRSVGATLSGYLLSSPIVRCAVLASPPVDLVKAFGWMRCEGDGAETRMPAHIVPSGQLKGDYCLSREFFAELPDLTAKFESAVTGAQRVLVTYGAADEKVTPMHAKRLMALLGTDSEFVLVADAGHNYHGFEAPVVDSAVAWFRRHLGPVR